MPASAIPRKLTEPERGALIDAIVLRLQKPMTDAGYDDDRIREIASTTRIRFVDWARQAAPFRHIAGHGRRLRPRWAIVRYGSSAAADGFRFAA